jgi:hypothetical protein
MTKSGADDPCNQIPPIKRARGYRIYDQGGRRFLDLYQNGGVSILGHRSEGLLLSMKNVMSRGLIFDMPSLYIPRLCKELSRRYPAYRSFLLAGNLAEAMALLSRLTGTLGKTGAISYHRPFLPEPANVRALLPVFPFRVGGGPTIVCLKDGDPVSCSRDFSPFLIAGLLRSMHNLRRFVPPPWYDGALLRGSKGWIQRGPYIAPAFDTALYPTIFKRFLDEGILLSPCCDEPSILPGTATEGELKKMVRLFSEYPEQ